MNSCELVQNWIFEHACKYDRLDVLSYFFEENLWGSNRSPQNGSLEKHQYALCLIYFKCILQHGKKKPEEIYADCNILENLIHAIPPFFSKHHFISTSKCFKMLKWIKTLDLLVSLKEGKDIISGKIRSYFPNDVKASLETEFNVMNYEKIDKLNEDYKFLRQYVYMICLTDGSLKKYINSKFNIEFHYIVTKVQKLLSEFVDVMSSNCASSPVDQVMSAAEEMMGCGDAAIELLLDSYKPDMTDAQMIYMLKLFFPQSESSSLLEQQYQSVPESQFSASAKTCDNTDTFVNTPSDHIQVISASKKSLPISSKKAFKENRAKKRNIKQKNRSTFMKLKSKPSKRDYFTETSEDSMDQLPFSSSNLTSSCNYNSANNKTSRSKFRQFNDCNKSNRLRTQKNRISKRSEITLTSKELLSKCKKLRINLKKIDISSDISSTSGNSPKKCRIGNQDNFSRKQYKHINYSADDLNALTCDVIFTRRKRLRLNRMNYWIYY